VVAAPSPGWNAVKLGFHCVTTHWIRGFMLFCRRGRRTRGPVTASGGVHLSA